MKFNEAGLELLKSFEKCALKAYKPTPEDKWTVGWGCTHGVQEGQEITQEEADAWLARDVGDFSAGVSRVIEVPLSDNQFSALVCFAYNVGLGAFSARVRYFGVSIVTTSPEPVPNSGDGRASRRSPRGVG